MCGDVLYGGCCIVVVFGLCWYVVQCEDVGKYVQQVDCVCYVGVVFGVELVVVDEYGGFLGGGVVSF